MARNGKLERAYLVLVPPPDPPTAAPRLSRVLASAEGERSAKGKGLIDFWFNPASYEVVKDASWTRRGRPWGSAALPEFEGAKAMTMRLEMFLDQTEHEQPKVAQMVDKLLEAVVPTQATIQRKEPSPPWVVFGWGRRVPMVGIATSVSANYTMFAPDGEPLRAVCHITLEEVPTDPAPRQNPTSGGLAPVGRRQVIEGDTLASIAHDRYRDPTRWRILAEANGIDDPFRLRAGDALMIPELDVGGRT